MKLARGILCNGWSSPKPLWLACTGSVYRVTGACSRIKMLTGRFPLNKSRYELDLRPDPLCSLCKTHSEDITHFLLACPVSNHISSPKIVSLQSIHHEQKQAQPITHFQITSAILNGWAYQVDEASKDYVVLKYHEKANILCSALCYKLDKNRASITEIKEKDATKIDK